MQHVVPQLHDEIPEVFILELQNDRFDDLDTMESRRSEEVDIRGPRRDTRIS